MGHPGVLALWGYLGGVCVSLGVVLCVCARRSMWGCLCEPGRCVCVVCVRVCVMLGSRGTSGHPDSVGVSRGSLSRCGLWLRLFRPGVQAAASGTRTRPSPILALQQRPRASQPRPLVTAAGPSRLSQESGPPLWGGWRERSSGDR